MAILLWSVFRRLAVPRRLMAFLVLAALLPAGCVAKRELLPGKGTDEPARVVGATANFFIDYPLGEITGDKRAVVRMYRQDSNSFDHDYQFRFERPGSFTIEGLTPGTYDVEAFRDLNGTLEPEPGMDALGGKLAAPYDDARPGVFLLKEGVTTRIDLALLAPLSGATPVPGEVGVGNYADFSWDPVAGAKGYEFRVRGEDGLDRYRVRVFAPRVRYGDVPAPADGAILKFPAVLANDAWYRWNVTAFGATEDPIAYLAERRFVP